jgi:hypothetical protein
MSNCMTAAVLICQSTVFVSLNVMLKDGGKMQEILKSLQSLNNVHKKSIHVAALFLGNVNYQKWNGGLTYFILYSYESSQSPLSFVEV